MSSTQFQPQLFDQSNMNNVVSIAAATEFGIAAPQLPQIKVLTIQKAMAMLNAAGCKYAIVDELGGNYGTLKLAAPEPVKPPKKRKYKGVTEYIKDQLKDVQVGGSTIVLPNEQYPLMAIRNTTASTCIKLWGEGNYKTHTTDSAVEVLRFA